MTPAPFSPATLKRIREGASAADLGWNQQRYNRICDTHGLEKVASADNVKAVVLGARAVDYGRVNYNPATGLITCGYQDVLLSGGREKDVFEFLFARASRDDDTLVSRNELIATTGVCSLTYMGSLLRRLSAKIEPVQCRIEYHVGASGGCRLVVRP